MSYVPAKERKGPPPLPPDALRERRLKVVPDERLRAGASSLAKELRDKGKFEERPNEDSFLADHKRRLYAVFDGMGGHEGGEVASALAKEEVQDVAMAVGLGPKFLEVHPDIPEARGVAERLGELHDYLEKELKIKPFEFASEREVEEMVASGLEAAQKKVRGWVEQTPDKKGGTTASLLAFYETADGAFVAKVANVGDSRIYRFHEGRLEQVTKDDSLYNELVKAGVLTGSEREEDPIPPAAAPTVEKLVPGARYIRDIRHIIMQAVGQREKLRVQVESVAAAEGDIFLLVSDGISDNITGQELNVHLAPLKSRDPGAIAAAITEYARQISRSDNPRAKSDDMTVVAVRVNRGEALEERLKSRERDIAKELVKFDDDRLMRKTAQMYQLRNQIEFAMKRPDTNPKLELLHAHVMRVLQMIDARQRKLGRLGEGEEADTIPSA